MLVRSVRDILDDPSHRLPRARFVCAPRAWLGPFVARDLVAAGAVVPGILTTSAATADATASRSLCRQLAHGLRRRGHTLSLVESLDALAILSPPETHAALLRLSDDPGLAVLCRNPSYT